MKTLNELSNEGVKFVVIKKDDTTMWHDDIQAKVIMIETVCLIDLTQPTNLCELAVSYPYEEIKNFFTFKTDISEEEQNNQLEESEFAELGNGYFNGGCKFKISKVYDDERDFEEVMENEQCNPTIC